MKSKKDTKKIQVKQKKKTRKKQTNKRKTKKESCKIGSGRTYRKRQRRRKLETCAICLGKIYPKDAIKTKCRHLFHFTCLDQWCESKKNNSTVTCPVCRTPIHKMCSDLYQNGYEAWHNYRQIKPIPPMVDIPRWYTGEVVFPQTQISEGIPPPQTPEDIRPQTPPGYPPYPDTPVDSPPMSISSSIEFIPRSPSESPPSSRTNSISSSAEPGESFFYDSPPDESTMDVVEIIEPLEPNISNSLSPIQPTNSLSPESRINRNQYDETLNRMYDRLRQ